MLLENIKKASMEALKQRDRVARAIYEVILNECQIRLVDKRTNGEELNDTDVIQILQKTLKELAEEKENYLKVGNTEEADNIDKQSEILKTYLPAMLSEQEIRSEIEKLDDKSIGSVMRHFKQNFAGKVDMSLVQSVFKSL